MSVAGGTGSGLGTRTTELLRDTYPHSCILNQVRSPNSRQAMPVFVSRSPSQVVWPYSSGEVIVQNYNALLSLSHLANVLPRQELPVRECLATANHTVFSPTPPQASDGVILVENDAVHQVCQQMWRLKKVTFADLNKVPKLGGSGFRGPGDPLTRLPQEIAQTLAGVLQPSSLLGSTSALRLCDLLERLCPHPAYKLLTMRAVPQVCARLCSPPLHRASAPPLLTNPHPAQMPDNFKEYTTYQVDGLAVAFWC